MPCRRVGRSDRHACGQAPGRVAPGPSTPEILVEAEAEGHEPAEKRLHTDGHALPGVEIRLTEEGEIKRTMIKATNLTPYNWLKHGMNLTSLEALFERNATEGLR